MKLNELFEGLPEIEIKHLFSDSRKKTEDSIFFCIKGMMFDGHKFVDQAIDNGAIVVVHSDEIENKRDNVTYIKVKDVLGVFNIVADKFYGEPSHKMRMFGVTGTNGKSSTASIIKDLYNEFVDCGYIGTIDIEYGSVKLPALLTTPDIDDLHGILSEMYDAGMKACSLEASSMGIEQRRIDSIDFDVAIFTNLTHEHLDYHGTMQNYFLAKKKFFDDLKEGAVAVTNVDDPYGMQIVKDTKAKVVTYGIDNDADYRITEYQLLKNKTRFKLEFGSRVYELETNLVAKFNMYNLLGALAALVESGLSIEDLQPFLNDIHQISGRMHRVDDGQPFNIIVDYAHTPDGIEKLGQFASAITPKDKRIIVVLGSAGKRDKTKRPIMGAVLDKYCDMIILTDEDSRNEDPYVIAEEIAQGIEKTNYVIIVDRYDAIRQAIEMAEPNDLVMVLGKGDERFMDEEFGSEDWIGDINACHDILKKYYFTEE